MDKIVQLDQVKLGIGVTTLVWLIIAVSSFYADYQTNVLKTEQALTQIIEVKSDVRMIKDDIADIQVDIARIAESLKKNP